ncbi:MAG: FMN-binding protein [Flavobacteriales bacterium]|nr:FMN-binding protein [Flavobacteriales bacterium]
MTKKKYIISRTIALLTFALLFSSFKFSDWEYEKKSRVKIHTSISKIFNSGTYILNDLDDTFYSIKENDSIVGYLAVTKALSKFHSFDFYIIFDEDAKLLKVEILHYRENYGAEICNKNWLKQFIGIDTKSYSDLNRKIDGISGATLSVNSIKKEVFKTANKLKLNYDVYHKTDK